MGGKILPTWAKNGGPDRTIIEGAKNSAFRSARALWNTSVLSFVHSFVCPQEKSDHLCVGRYAF